jgi:endonuclease III-like uncharacterized protein
MMKIVKIAIAKTLQRIIQPVISSPPFYNTNISHLETVVNLFLKKFFKLAMTNSPGALKKIEGKFFLTLL